MNTKKDSRYLDLDEAEREFGIDSRTLYRRIKEGDLPGYKPFGKLMVKRKDMEAIFERSRVQSA